MSIKIDITKSKKIHFIGIGGSSMSGIAKLLFLNGYYVSGSDRQRSDVTRELQDMGIHVEIGHSFYNVDHSDIVVYTDAISKDNIELREAVLRGKIVLKRVDFLNIILHSFREKIAVSGTHGKSTTTKMLQEVFSACGNSPTTFLGVSPSYIEGGEKFVVYEACEYKRNFLFLDRTICCVLNIDYDHMDYYKDMDDILSGYRKFVENKISFINGDDDNCKTITNSHTLTVGYGNDCDYRADNVTKLDGGNYSYSVIHKGKNIADVCLKVIGKHNVFNSLMSFAVAHFFGFNTEYIVYALNGFTGIKRRMQYMGKYKGCDVVLDYAHHPKEIISTIEAIRGGDKNKKIVCIFQPHMYSRLKNLFDDFAKCFDVRQLILTKVYAAREKKIRGVTSKALMRRCQKNCVNVKYSRTFLGVKRRLKKVLQKNDLLLILGAGDIDRLAKMLCHSSSSE